MHHGAVRFGTFLIVLVLTLATPATSLGQDGTPSASDTGHVDQLFAVPLETLPSGPVSVQISRWTVAPGASQSISALPGPALYLLESGSLSAQSGDAASPPASVQRATENEPETVEPGTTVNLGPGDLLVVPGAASISLQNVGTEPATELEVEFSPGEATRPSQSGVSQQRLASGTIEPPPPPVAVSMSRLTLPPSVIMPPHEVAGPEFLIVEEGTCSLALHPGQMTITRGDGAEESVTAGEYDPLASPVSEEEEEEGEHAGHTPVPGQQELNGTVAGLTAGDSILIAAGGRYTLQGGKDEPALLLILSIAQTGA